MKKQLLLLLSIMAPLGANPVAHTGGQVIKAARVAHTHEEKLTVEVSAGELFDKLTILQIKMEHITHRSKLCNIQNEREAIELTIQTQIPMTPALSRLVAELKAINQALWDIEDAIRAKEAAQEFDQEFIDLARSVYFTNDKRGMVKREINELVGSRLMEEKQYTNYEQK